MPLQQPRHVLGHIWPKSGMDYVCMIPIEGAIFQARARYILPYRELAATLEVLPLLTRETGKLTQVVDEGRREKFPVSDASPFHALQHLQSVRELAAREQKNIRGIHDLRLKL